MNRGLTLAGGGLAGLSLGIALRERGIEVDLHEAGSYPRHRVCGEFICGVSPETLKSLGVWRSFQFARPLLTSAWIQGETQLLRSTLERPAWGISRHQLDAELSERFQSLGGRLFQQSRLPNEPREGLVWTAGRVPERGDWLGLKCHLANFELECDLEMHLGDGGYVGLARIENDQVNLCGLFRKQPNLQGRGSEWLIAYLRAIGLTALADQITRAHRVETSFLGVAGFQLGFQRRSPHAIALGDAYAMIPPFTGNGMSMAFESAAVALDPLTDYAHGRTTWAAAADQIRTALARKFSIRMALARTLHPILTQPPAQKVAAFIARRGLLPYQSCFHALR